MMNTEALYQLQAGIRMIWDRIPKPSVIMTQPLDFEMQYNESYLRDRTYDELPGSEWIESAWVLDALTPDAARYYIGGYLLRILQDLLEPSPTAICGDLAVGELVGFLTNQNACEAMLSLMDKDERMHVRQIVSLCLEHSEYFDLTKAGVAGLSRMQDCMPR
jgi:hypothetical protein